VDFDQGQKKADIDKSGHLKLQRWKKYNYWERYGCLYKEFSKVSKAVRTHSPETSTCANGYL